MIPANIKVSIDDYVDHGHPVGGFVYHVMCDDLFEAAFRADENSLTCLAGICRYVFNFTPSPCWASAQKVDEWRRRHAADPVGVEKVARVDREKRRDYGETK